MTIDHILKESCIHVSVAPKTVSVLTSAQIKVHPCFSSTTFVFVLSIEIVICKEGHILLQRVKEMLPHIVGGGHVFLGVGRGGGQGRLENLIRRRIKLIEGNAKYLRLKKVTWIKGTVA
jgi:hypothetical protein